MKRSPLVSAWISRRSASLLLASAMWLLAFKASAQSLTWDPITGTTGAQNGLGNWNTTANNWWDGTANALWTNSTTAIANIGVVGGTTASQQVITLTENIQLADLRFRSISTTTPTSLHQYTINGDVAGGRILDFGLNGLIQMEDFSSGGSQFVGLGANLRLKGENLRIQKFGSGTAFQFITLGMTQNPDLIGTLTIAGSIYATISSPNTIQAISRVVVEAGGSAPLSGTNPNYTQPFSLAGFGNSLTNTGTSYGAIRFVSNNTTISGGILLTADAGVHTNFSGANGTTGIVINSVISDGGNNRAFHRFAFTRGDGTLTLSAPNTYGGATVLGRSDRTLASYSGGVTILDFTAATAPQNDIIYNGLATPGRLDFIGGNSPSVLRLAGKSGQTNSQRFANVTVNGTHNALELLAGSGGAVNLTMGTLTRTDVNATMSITGPTSGSITTTQPDGFLGPWLSYTAGNGSRSWGKVAGGVIASGYAGDTAYVTGDSLSSAPYAATSHVGISSASTGALTLGAGTTPLSTVSMADYTSERQIDLGIGQTLRLGTQGGIQVLSGARPLTVGTLGVASTLSAGGTVTGTAGSLFLSNHSATSPLTIHSNLANNGSGLVTLVVNGAPGSRTVLTGTNAHTGGTQISSGILEVRNNAALGTTGTVTVVDGATLALSGGVTISRALGAIGGFGDGNNGAIRSLSGDNFITSSITQNAMFLIAADAGASLTIQPTSTITYSSVLTFGGAGTVTVNAALTGAGAISKIGNGLLLLSGTNTYTGATTASAGILKLNSAAALGATSGVAITAGGTLDLNGQSTARSFTSINGTGVGSGGALINSSATTSTITGTAALSTASVIGGSGNITISNATGLTGNVLLTKIGNGTLSIINSTTTSARTGANQIDAGTLRVQSPIAIAPVGTAAYVMNGGTLSLGFDVANTMTNVVNVINNSTIIADRASAGAGGTTLALSTLTIGGNTLTVKAGDNVTSSTMGLTLGSTVIGGVSMKPGNPTFDVQSTALSPMILTLGALSDQAIAPRSITFQNSGSVASTVTLAAGASSLVDGTAINLANTGGALTLNMNLAAALGTLAQVTVGSGNTLSIGAAQTIGSLAGSGTVSASGAGFTLTVGNALNNTAFNTSFSGVLANGAGPLALTKAGKGTLTLDGSSANTYTGLTTVSAGTLVLAKTGGALAVGGSLTIGAAASGTAGNATVRLDASDQMINTGALVMNAGSTLNLNGFNQTVLTFSTAFGATVTGTGSALAVSNTSGTMTFTGVNSISSGLQLTTGVAATRTVAITNATDLLTISGPVTQGSTVGSITRTGSGTLVLSGDNSYAGVTTITSGIINIRHANALGTTVGNTVVSSGGTLQIQGGITTAAEGLSLNGVGFAGASGLGFQTGALVNSSGTNQYAGLVVLAAAATISSDSGTLNLTHAGTMTGATFALTLAGAGNGSIASIIGNTTGAVIKNGSGTWTLSGVNTSTGAITINSGTLKLGNGTTGRWSSVPGLTYTGTGTFQFGGSTAASTQALGALTLTSGAGTLQVDAPASGTNAVTFTSLATPVAGSGLNVVTPANTSVTLTGATDTNGIVNARMTYNGADFASSTAGVIGAAATTLATSSLSAGNTTPYLISGSFAQTSSVIANAGLKFASSDTFTLNNGTLLTINNGANTAGGLLVTGGVTAVIANEGSATGLTTDGTGDLVIRTNDSGDSLNIQVPITSTTTGGLTKNGAGTLTLSSASSYTGATSINEGTLILGNASAMSTSAATVRVGGMLNLNGQSIANAVTLNGTGLGSAGALINNTGNATVGALTIGTGLGTGAVGASIGGSANIESTGALVGNVILVKTGGGTLTFGSNGVTAVPSVRTGATRIDAGVLRISNSTSALGAATSQITLNGGTLSLGSSASVVAYPTAVTANSSIVSDVFTSGAGLVHTLGTLAIGGQTLTVTAGSNVTTASTNAGVTFGATTLTGSPTFDVQSPTTATSGTTTLTLGALNDQGVAKTITFANSGTSSINSIVTLSLAMASLVEGTTVNINSGTNAGVTLNLAAATALGTLAQVNVSGNSTLNIGAAQTLGSLSGNGTVTASGVFSLTIGNANSSPALSTNFTGTLSNGAGTLALIKNGLGTLTLTPTASTYTGTTTVSAGILKLGNAGALGTTIGVLIGVGGTVDLNGQSTDRSFTSINGTGHDGGGALINSSGTTSTITGTSVLVGPSKIGGSGNITFNNAGGLTGSSLLTKFGSGTLTFISTTTSARTGTNQIDAGTLRVQAATAIAPIGTGAYAMNGGTLSLGFDAAGTVGGAVNLLSNSTIIVDRASSGAGGIALTLGALTLGGNTLTVKAGDNVTSSSIGLTLGTTTIGGTMLAPGNPIFDVQSTATATTTLTLGAITDQAIAPRTITFQNSGSAASVVTLGTASTSLVNGTLVNIASTGGAVTLNMNIANALGTFAQVTVGSGNTLSLGATQTIAALNGSGTVTASAPAILTIGNVLSPTISSSVFNGTLAGGANLSVVKAGQGSLTLGGSSTYAGGTTVTGGSLIVTNTSGSATGAGPLTMAVGTTLSGEGRIESGSGNSVSIYGTLSVGTNSANAADMDIITSGAGTFFIDGSGVLVFDLISGAGLGNNSANAASADLLRIGGTTTLMPGATLRLNGNGLSGYAVGDQWKLFDWTSLGGTSTGSFTHQELPTLDFGMSWDLSQLYSLGTISISVVPEPSRAALMMFAALALGLRRSRRASTF